MKPQEPTVPVDDALAAAVDEPVAQEVTKPRRPRARKVVQTAEDAPGAQSDLRAASGEGEPVAVSPSDVGVPPVPRTRKKKVVSPSAEQVNDTPNGTEPIAPDAIAVDPVLTLSAVPADVSAPVASTAPNHTAATTEVDEDDDDEDAGLPPAPRLEPRDVGEVFEQVMSGEFDGGEAEGALPPLPPKRVLLPDPDAPKLHKVLAQAGVGSRRDMEQMIVDGLITVNGQPAHTGQRISFGDQIKVDGKPVRVSIVPPAPRIIAYHKPAGEVVTHDDPQHRPTVFRRLPRLPKGKWQSVGRLDLNTEGLLLFTNSGELANQLMHPRFGVEREYAVRVLGTLESEAKAKLLAGVEIEGQVAGFKAVAEGGGEGVNRWYRVVITEGRNREVRKLFEAVGLTVSRLIRIRYGTVVLPRGLKRGAWVDLAPEDVQIIRQLAGGGAVGGHAGAGRKGRDGRNRRNKPLRGVEVSQQQHPSQRRNHPYPERGNERIAPRQSQVTAALPRHDDGEDDFDPRQIPNPLEQTFDKRFVQNPRSPAGGRGFRNGGGGFGTGGSGPAPLPPRKPGAPREPDPLQTSVGYIGADAFHRKGRGSGGGGGGGGGGRSGGHRGGGGFGGKRGR